jgi:superfamily I DNA/RNA helicase
MAKMAPEIADRVEFMSVHAFAHGTLQRAGIRSLLEPTIANQGWSHAWLACGKASSLNRVDANPTYWRDEVRSVIKGRALVSLEEYQACSRAGRTRRLTADQRAEVWGLFTAYQRELVRRGVWDFEDVVNNAAPLVGATHGSTYSAVIVDEAQDLSCSMVRLLHALVGDAPDAFNLIGDGQQSIYPGGYTLSELGISIAGRGVVLSRNYRNTAEIASYASTIVAGDVFTDIEGRRESRDAAEFTRHGRRPQVVSFSNVGEHDARLIDHIRQLLADGQTTAGDIGVLALYRRQVDSLIAGLTRAGIRTVNLDDYAGTRADAVRVGTVKRAKGLEFKQVLVAHAPKLLIAPASAAAGGERDDVDDLIRRELYVAMTRARDGLWVGVA